MLRIQSTSSVLMVRPSNFHYNSQTSQTNTYMQSSKLTESEQNYLARQEFTTLVDKLIAAGVDVLVVDDTPQPETPDAIFPNNWISMHHDGTLITYPMEAANRRLERKATVLDAIKARYQVNKQVALEHFEASKIFLESTGSIVFDHNSGIGYAGLSTRTHQTAIQELAKHIPYQFVEFDAVDRNGDPIYHTNVLMGIGSDFACVCLDSISDKQQKQKVIDQLAAANKVLIPISHAQLASYCGNLLELRDKNNEPLIVMSQEAWQGYNHQQQKSLESYGTVVFSAIPTIEHHAGGSVRCMIAEIFLPRI